MLLINRGEDPIAQDDVKGATKPMNSMLKFALDIFGRKTTGSQFFFLNDLHVLLDIIIRELTDRAHADAVRPVLPPIPSSWIISFSSRVLPPLAIDTKH